MRIVQAILKRATSLILAFMLGIVANMLCIYALPDTEIGTTKYDLAKAKENVLLWWYQPHAIEVVILPKQERRGNYGCVKPNPLLLIVNIDKAGHVTLNGKDSGTLADISELTNKLEYFFAERLKYRAYRENLDELDENLPEFEKIERTVFIKAAPSLRYEQVLNFIDKLKGTGAEPINLVIDADDYSFDMNALPAERTRLVTSPLLR